jgi:hypothetical protein
MLTPSKGIQEAGNDQKASAFDVVDYDIRRIKSFQKNIGWFLNNG